MNEKNKITAKEGSGNVFAEARDRQGDIKVKRYVAKLSLLAGA